MAFAYKVKLEHQLNKIQEFITLYDRSLSSNVSKSRMTKMLTLQGHLPNVITSPIIRAFRVDNLNTNGYYQDPITDWQQELSNGSRAPIELLTKIVGEIEQTIFEIENSYYQIEFFDQVKDKAKIFLSFLFKTTAGKIASSLIAAGLAYLAFSLFGIKINP
jgi:hypothetical protein